MHKTSYDLFNYSDKSITKLQLQDCSLNDEQIVGTQVLVISADSDISGFYILQFKSDKLIRCGSHKLNI